MPGALRLPRAPLLKPGSPPSDVEGADGEPPGGMLLQAPGGSAHPSRRALPLSRKDATNRMRRIPPSIPALVFHSFFLRALVTRRPPANLPYRFFFFILIFIFFPNVVGSRREKPGLFTLRGD